MYNNKNSKLDKKPWEEELLETGYLSDERHLDSFHIYFFPFISTQTKWLWQSPLVYATNARPELIKCYFFSS